MFCIDLFYCHWTAASLDYYYYYCKGILLSAASVSIAADNGIVIAASYWGKFKTVSQMIMIILMIMNLDNQVFQGAITLFVVIAVALTIISLIDYIVKNKSVLSMQD